MRDIDFAAELLPGEQLHGMLAAMRARHPVTPARFGGREAFVITGHAALAEALDRNERFPPAEPYRIPLKPVQGRTLQNLSLSSNAP